MKRKVIGLVMLSLVATAWGRGELRTSTIDGVTYTYTISERDGGKIVTLGGWNGKPDESSLDKLAISKTTRGNIVIPSSIDGIPVKEIGLGAFSGCMNLTSVSIPEGVESIGHSAFKDCISLASITLPSTLKEIDGFENCISLTSVKIPDGVVSVKGFSGCTSLESITIPETVKELGDFENCRVLKSIFIPNGVRKIGSFSRCESLPSVFIPDSVISFRGFGYCTSLTSIILPASIVDIPEDAFVCCRSLTNVTMRGDVMCIGKCAFMGCENLASIEIPSTTRKIEWRAFHLCSSLTTFIIPSSVMILEDAIFDHCNNLSNIVFMGEPPKCTSRLIYPAVKMATPVGMYSSKYATKWKEEMKPMGRWHYIPMIEVPSLTDGDIYETIAKVRKEMEGKRSSALAKQDNANGKNTMRERRRARRQGGNTSQAKTPEQKTELDFLRDAINEFKGQYDSESLEGRNWEGPTTYELSTLKRQGISNEVCRLAFDYLTCTQKVESAQKNLIDYKLSEANLTKLTAEESEFYHGQVSNKIAHLERIQGALTNVVTKMTPFVLAVVPMARDIREEEKRLNKERERLASKAREMEGKFVLLRKGLDVEPESQLIAEDLNGLNVSNLVIRQVCRIPNSGGYLGLRVFSYALTITDGRITKIEELPEEKLGELPIIPTIIEKNK